MIELQPYFQSIAVIAALALVWGGTVLLRRGRERFKGALMIVAALVVLGNLLIWAMPVAAGT